MLVDLDLLYDDLDGYAFFHKDVIESVIDDKAKCSDGSVIEFHDDVEDDISEGDDIIVLEKKDSAQELERLLPYFKEKGSAGDVKFLMDRIQTAKETGYHRSYIALCNDSVFSVYNFRL